WIICARKSSPISWYCFFSGRMTALSTFSPVFSVNAQTGRPPGQCVRYFTRTSMLFAYFHSSST
ncbi:hypothetical protein, partial [Klebsiella pneumoniae]|uniref:hypothetical protein n=1 Tax=Klebsiella pneumoniae TaxID=573 RepID=UPI001953B2F9